MKVQATCLECDWKSGTYQTGMTSKRAVTEGDAHNIETGHAVSVPKFARGKNRIIAHRDRHAWQRVTAPATGNPRLEWAEERRQKLLSAGFFDIDSPRLAFMFLEVVAKLEQAPLVGGLDGRIAKENGLAWHGSNPMSASWLSAAMSRCRNAAASSS
jgi:hypothetical protein